MRKLFRLRGITLCDVEILEAMDKGEEAFVLPPVLQKSGELRKDAKALTLPQMKALMEHARQTAAALAQEMMDGKTDICPVRDGGQAYCNRCDYQSVCHFDPESAQAKVRSCPTCPCRSFGTCWNRARDGIFRLFTKKALGQVAIPRGIMYNRNVRERRTALTDREKSKGGVTLDSGDCRKERLG